MYQICISGSSKGKSAQKGHNLAVKTGEAVAKAGLALMTGATMGLPHASAEAYKKAGGKVSVGISPASSKVEHVMKYRLPTQPYDSILYTGMNYVGRDMFLVNSSDAVISIGGRLGTLHEAVIALETDTPIAFLEGAGGTGAEILDILRAAGREPTERIIFGDDPKVLLEQLVIVLNEERKHYKHLFTA